MPPVGPKLKELRLRAKPKLSIRRIAEELEIPFASYAFYERPDGYKKPFLPLDFARRVAAILAGYGVDPADVMALAGLTEAEAEPEAREIESQRPAFISITLPVVLPSEVALRDMFRSLLVLVPEGATKDEAADILARRLPAGLAACGPLALDQASVASLGGTEMARSSSYDRTGSAEVGDAA